MTDIKFAVKNGRWEISYEGPEEFLRTELRGILEYLFESSIWKQNASAGSGEVVVAEFVDGDENTDNRSIPQMTVNNVCAKLNCQTGPDLVIAACAYLTFMQGQDYLARRDVLAAMREATRYYKDTYGSNLTAYLQTLVKQGKLMERSSEVYVLRPAYASELEGVLAQP